MDDAETKTKRNRVATDQSAAFLCKVGAASDWNGRGSIESIRPGDRLSRSSRKLSAIAPLSTLPAIPSTRFLFSPLPRAISPSFSITRANRYSMLYLSSTFISRADIFIFLEHEFYESSLSSRIRVHFLGKFVDVRPS